MNAQAARILEWDILEPDRLDRVPGERTSALDLAPATFGAGGAEPYAAALRNADNVLYLRRSRDGGLIAAATMDAARWSADADDTDQLLLDGLTGPVLDIGCGPGRMVRAAMDRGLSALGIDVSPTAVRIAVDAGLSVLKRSVFDPMPLEGGWAGALLVDGNIGIGGDVTALLTRCAELLAPRGALLVEVSHDPARNERYEGRLEDASGLLSDVFPWAEVGVDALAGHAADAGLRVAHDWRLDGRWFARLLHA
ncbi:MULTISPECIES: bifunctional 2-polyprenyl-6-hydroxyphenol methylase/3-demethylubiquinol 3-O-methyltransferase UbiG [Cryobacterium]|uniref:Class I SAM-dependent methyltransferase n=1 Tax=Cryobacterium glucosi TaxID=1259175 RepID=A0ABY2IKN5_9MICO|nr:MULTISPECIES: methyltransferase domain-containing protein [Cryobacterium]MEB0203031.1 methyltransferase domain-containing protein [Cryobacterium sp. 5I3]MEB0288087.1 methyltransferase domain-containing protein [Cryobacterium sp. 10S3]TFB97966.1 class I SAM-dependent methyltransferase [Cryobacterium sp. MDB2-A-1]TFC09799.1 class I SAM-dependent methyltransferase [Cryobacterium sp. MDB2-33-2]TFC10900.1 class I SAM-dependent methyltransferase [Cryobacterium sp. MDB2-A-2]